jgi:hypothetical protein
LQARDGRRTTVQPMQRPRFLESAAHRDERPIGHNEEMEKIVRDLVSDSTEMEVISLVLIFSEFDPCINFLLIIF